MTSFKDNIIMQRLEQIKFLDKETGDIIDASYQSIDNKFGIFVKRLDNNEPIFIQEEDIVESSTIDREVEKFVKKISINDLYISNYNYLAKLNELTVNFLIEKTKLSFDILEKNWLHHFNNFENFYKVPEGTNKWGNSGHIFFNKDVIQQEEYHDLSRYFKIIDKDEKFNIYNIFLALEILSRKLNENR